MPIMATRQKLCFETSVGISQVANQQQDVFVVVDTHEVFGYAKQQQKRVFLENVVT